MAAPMQSATVVLPNVTFVSPYFQPVKRIKTHDDLPKFQKSNTMKVYMDFLEKCSTAVTDKKVSDEYPASPVRSNRPPAFSQHSFKLTWPILDTYLPFPSEDHR